MEKIVTGRIAKMINTKLLMTQPYIRGETWHQLALRTVGSEGSAGESGRVGERRLRANP